jgi:hypothetical protein
MEILTGKIEIPLNKDSVGIVIGSLHKNIPFILTGYENIIRIESESEAIEFKWEFIATPVKKR